MAAARGAEATCDLRRAHVSPMSRLCRDAPDRRVCDDRGGVIDHVGASASHATSDARPTCPSRRPPRPSACWGSCAGCCPWLLCVIAVGVEWAEHVAEAEPITPYFAAEVVHLLDRRARSPSGSPSSWVARLVAAYQADGRPAGGGQPGAGDDGRGADQPPPGGDGAAGDRQPGAGACQPGAAPARPHEVGVRVPRVAPAACAADEHHGRAGARGPGRAAAATVEPTDAPDPGHRERAAVAPHPDASSMCRAWRLAGCSSTWARSPWSRSSRAPRRRRWMPGRRGAGTWTRPPACRPPGRTSSCSRRSCATCSRTRPGTHRRAAPIDSGARLVEGVLEVSVTDHGPGVPAEEQARIFESFHRVGDVETAVAGYGLGLYFADRLIRAQHGTVGVESPVGAADSPAPAIRPAHASGSGCPSPAAPRTRTTTSRGRRPATPDPGARLMARIMLVDDDRSLLELLGDYLGRLGHSRDRDRRWRGGAGRLAVDPPDLVILDVTMPGLDGWRVLARIRAIIAGARDHAHRPRGRARCAAWLRGRRRRLRDQALQLRAAGGARRRRSSIGRRGTAPRPGPCCAPADLEVDVERHRVTRGGRARGADPHRVPVSSSRSCGSPGVSTRRGRS